MDAQLSVTESEKKQQLHISVRSLVEFIFREGDIDNRRGRSVSAEAMLEGSRTHRRIQESHGGDYQAEVPLTITVSEDLYDLTIEGRADGIFTEDDVWIDEIKGVYRNVKLMEEPVYVHQAQALCYAYIFARQNQLQQIGIQMTYCNMDTEEIKYFRTLYTWPELEEWFQGLCREYYKWAAFQCSWHKIRQASIRPLEFPFSYREGQKKLVGDVYRSILRKKNLFIQAPTGVGKTISTLFPAVKAVGEDLADRIFYLTAKTVTAAVAMDTFEILRGKGYRAKIIHLTAKEKMCLCDEMECNPVNCPYAKGHFDRVNDAVYEILQQEDVFERETILAQARKSMVCPFELQLDISSWCDCIVCDYNYVFDPNVRLKRFFADGVKGDYLFLIDEAHNLVDRSREMYSAELYKEDFLSVKKIMKPHNKAIEKQLEKCNRILLGYKRECEKYVLYDDIGSLLPALTRLASSLSDFLDKPGEFAGRKDVLEFYMNLRNFLNICDLTDERYVIYSELQEDGRFMLKLFCVDPSANLQKCLDQGRAAVLFSATLLPISYYKRLLSTREDNYAVYAETAFSQDQRLLIFGRDVSTKYTRRNQAEFRRIAEYLYEMIRGKKGNYMIFFPSYKLMEDVCEVFLKLAEEKAEYVLGDGVSDAAVRKIQDTAPGAVQPLRPRLECMIQKSGMREQEREEFLNRFSEGTNRTLAAFCVMGGIFGEGIDLKNDQLIGAAIVGTGLPQVSNEKEILKNYYDENRLNGFDYAYRYPGLNKVLQAAGRVIRTETDRGVILLLDERFLQPDYRNMFPREWEQRQIIRREETAECIRSFWKEADADS